MKTFSALLLPTVFVLAGPAFAAPVPKENPKPTTEKLVGVWKLAKTDAKLPDGMEVTVEFTADGALVLRMSIDNTTNSVSRGTFKADADKIHYTIESAGGERKETLTVKTLTADTLVLIDPDKKREEFRRVLVVKK